MNIKLIYIVIAKRLYAWVRLIYIFVNFSRLLARLFIVRTILSLMLHLIRLSLSFIKNSFVVVGILWMYSSVMAFLTLMLAFSSSCLNWLERISNNRDQSFSIHRLWLTLFTCLFGQSSINFILLNFFTSLRAI